MASGFYKTKILKSGKGIKYMLENDEKLSDEEVLDLVGAGRLNFELEILRGLQSIMINKIKKITGRVYEFDSAIDNVILDYISFVLTQGEISGIEYKFITKVFNKKYTKESLNEYLTLRRNSQDIFEYAQAVFSSLYAFDETDIQKGKLLPYLIEFLVKIDASYIRGDDYDFDRNLWLKNHLLYFENLSKWYKSGFEF